MDTDDGDQHRRQRQRQRRSRRLSNGGVMATAAAASVLSSAGPRRRAVPARRSCSAVADVMAVRPLRTLTKKRSTGVYRELCTAWNSRVGSQNTNAPAHRVQTLFNDLGLYPTAAQVAEMMQCVMKCANRGSPVSMTFGEFCLLAKKMKNGLDRGTPRLEQFSRLLEKDQENRVCRGIRKNSKNVGGSYDVFLGGSCNPTTWRKDLAVPYLQQVGVSFYNPQVDHWSQDLIEVEHAAKESATILFFVVDSQTRNVVSDIEIANFSGYRKNLVLVIHSEDVVAGSIVAGERISSKEAEDIKEALTVLHTISCDQGILTFDNIPQALRKVVQILKDKNHQCNDTGEDNSSAYRQVRDAFNIFDPKLSGKINISDIRMAIRFLSNQNMSENEVLNQISEINSSKVTGVEGVHQSCFTFDQFYAIASKYLQFSDKHNLRKEFDLGRTRHSTVGRSLNFPQECAEMTRSCVEMTRSSKSIDIYLAGESGDDVRWREDIAIPMIKKSSSTYHTTATSDLSVLLDARTLLFVIPNNSRSLATMTLAAYCIGKNYRMVLCIQNLSKDCTVRGEKLTQTAINDYNRGRSYLADLASRKQVPVLESITEAVEIAIQKSQL